MTFPTTPAAIAFMSDPRRTWGISRVHDYCQFELDLHEVRELKAWLCADALGMTREDVANALTWLVKNGYLIEHQRGARNVRNFTLPHSVAAERRVQLSPKTVTSAD